MHGSPEWAEQVPPRQVSVPLQYRPSGQGAPSLSDQAVVDWPISQISQGLAGFTVRWPKQTSPISHPSQIRSHESVSSLQISPGSHGSPVCPHSSVSSMHSAVSSPLQKSPSGIGQGLPK